MLLLIEMGVSWWFRGIAEQSGITKRVRDSYRANRRRLLVGTVGEVKVAFARFFSYAEMFFELRGATSNRKTGIPRLSRRPSHWGY
jgi:hypothetical protein